MILGDERETVGSIISIDGNEGVFKTEDGNIRMLPIKHLCKLNT